ncbi:uncharacterized protein H6S33_003749 [Morchella sextelata]|uniref:uncharacterized protein n=1 Tax=Morchella sextelata TaxID=1174677 RepID=UPI001D04B695|nr:uncharacterized protein H6S33_003749 [Morchella sextelata]KAH0606088.1 hypothetical protein H6S33_003749 [Morchella sextelata]
MARNGTPEDYRLKIILFWKFNRRNSQLAENEEESDVGRYPLGNMFNMDQTPFPFEFLTGRTYDFTGNSTIWERALRSGWVKPLLIFRGKGESKPIILESMRYNSRIRAIFNPKGYSNESITLDWLEKDLIPSSAFPEKPRFLALDVFAGQKTAKVLTAFRHSNTVTSFIPEGYTGLVQPLDTAVNKILKGKISELLDLELDKNRSLWEEGQFTVGDRRILMTWVVAEAWDWLHQERKELIVKSFRQVGISLAIDGSEDSEIKVKGLDNLEIGDWSEGGLDCNLNRLGKTGAGELEWNGESELLLDPVVAELAQNQLADIIDGEYIDNDDDVLKDRIR